MARKAYNPYRVQTETINRFRGIVNPENDQTIPKDYVGNSDNAVGFRIGEVSVRDGQEKGDFTATGKIHSARLCSSMFCISSGPDVFAEDIGVRLRRTADIDFPASIPKFSFTMPDMLTCADLWADNPNISQYEDASKADADPFANNNPIGECWNIPYGGGGGGGGSIPRLPDLPDPEQINPPVFDPIIPNIPPFNVPEDDGTDNPANRCRLLSASFDTTSIASASLVGEDNLDFPGAILTTTSSIGADVHVSVTSESIYFGASRSTQTTRSGGFATITTTAISITPITQETVGTYIGRIKVTLTVCDKEYVAYLYVKNVVSTARKVVSGYSFTGGYSRTGWWGEEGFTGSGIWYLDRINESYSNFEVYISPSTVEDYRPAGASEGFGFCGIASNNTVRFVAGFGVFPGDVRTEYADPVYSYFSVESYADSASIPCPDLSKYNSYIDEEGAVISPYYGEDIGFHYAGAATPPWYRSISNVGMSFSNCYTYATSEAINKVYGSY